MSAYADLIPGASPQRRTAYDDLLPVRAPAAAAQPAKDVGAEVAASPGILSPEEVVAQVPDTGGAGWGEVVKSIIPGAGAQIRSSLANLRRLGNEEAIRQREMVLEPQTPPAGAAVPHLVQRSLDRQRARLEADLAQRPVIEADAQAAMQDLADATPKDMSTVQKAVHAAGTSAPTTLAAIAAGIVSRSPALAMSIGGVGGGAIQAGSTYGEAREKWAPHAQAATAAGVDALLEGAGEALPLKFALAPGSTFARRLYSTIAAEAGQEAATQAMQDLNAFLTYNPEITLDEALENLKVAALAGGIGGAVYGGVGAAANAGRPVMHSEPVPATPEAVVEPEQVPPVETQPSAYEDLVPKGPDLEGRVEPTLEPVAPRESNHGVSRVEQVMGEEPIAEEVEALGMPEDKSPAPTQAIEALKSEFPGVDFFLAQHATTGDWKLHDLVVPKKERGKGVGSAFMERLTELADESGARLVLTAAQRDDNMGTTSKGRLIRFYRRFGFVPNKGRQKDYTITDTMYRKPGAKPKSLGMPAGTAVAPTVAAAGATPPARASKSVDKEQARPDAIRAAMRELFGAPISEKHQGSKNLGIYRVKPQTIRLRNRNDIRTAAHEVGHHISERNKAFRKVMRQHGNELVSIMPQAYKQMVAAGKPMSRKLQIEEGFAEFIAGWITERPALQAKVPGFYKAFEAWLAQNPSYAQNLQQVADMVGAHEALSPEDKILAKVGTFKPPLGKRVASLASSDTWDAFAQSVLDKWHPLKKMVDDLMPGVVPSKNPYAAARLLAGDAAIIEDWISDFTSPFDYAKRLDGKNYGKPLKAILEPVLKDGEVNKFKAYIIARRAAELKKVGKENLLTDEEIAAGLKLETALFKQVASEIYAYNDRLLDYAVEGGLLSEEVAAKFREYANYIPFFRESEGDGKEGRGDPFKRLTGGTANLRDPIANIILNTANIIHATNRNAMVKKAVELAKAVPGGGRWLETVPLPMQAHNIATKRILEDLKKQGLVIDEDTAKDLAAMQTFFMPSGRGDEKTKTIVYKDGGELKAAQVNDPLLWKALGNIPPLEMGLLGKIIAFPAKTLRAGVVLDPTFMARNFMRDTLSATVQSKGKFIPVLSTVQGAKMMAQQRDAYKLWRAFGGAFSDQFRESEDADAIVKKMAQRGGFSPSSIVTPTRWLDALRRVGSFAESGSRIGEFEATYKPGDLESAIQAALNAREVSTDFGMRGGSEAIQVLTRITPFMNPAMQGLYKTARVLSAGDGKAAAVKAAIVGTNMALLSMALALMNSNEDWYRSIEEWEKTTYWHFKVGDNVFRIPKPFEYGTLFASMPEAIALRVAGEEGGEDFKKRMLQALGQVFGFRVIPQAAALVAEPWANKSFFTGRQIVPDRQDRLEPGLQSNPNTSKVAQAVGEAANVSPAIIDNMVRNTFGTIGVHVSTVADLMLEGVGAFPRGRERGWQTWPVLKAFVRDPDNPNSKEQRDFYEALEKYRRAVNTVKEYRNRGEDAKADRYAEEKADEIFQAKAAETAAKRLSKLRKAIRSIEWDRDISPSEKRSLIREHNEEMQDIAREQTRLYQSAKRSYAR